MAKYDCEKVSELLKKVYEELVGCDGFSRYCYYRMAGGDEWRAIMWLEDRGIINPTLGFDDKNCEIFEKMLDMEGK